LIPAALDGNRENGDSKVLVKGEERRNETEGDVNKREVPGVHNMCRRSSKVKSRNKTEGKKGVLIPRWAKLGSMGGGGLLMRKKLR